MPCPTCNQTMHGLGEWPEFMSALTLLKVALNQDDANDIKRAAELIAKLSDVNSRRHFWCPNCGTVRTVTKRMEFCPQASSELACAVETEVDHNSDSPPRLVELVKAADDSSSERCVAYPSIPKGITAVLLSAWADVRRCIGRDKS